jgi:hypothetical protein
VLPPRPVLDLLSGLAERAGAEPNLVALQSVLHVSRVERRGIDTFCPLVLLVSHLAQPCSQFGVYLVYRFQVFRFPTPGHLLTLRLPFYPKY